MAGVGARQTAFQRVAAVVACAAVILLFGWIETRLAGQPYDGPHEDNAAAFTGAARNHIRYGFARTLGHDLQEPNTGWYGDTSVEHRYLHHPPGLSLTLAATMALFGDSRATARLTAACFQLFSLLAVLYGARRYLGGWWAAALAGALFSLIPLSAYYGRSVGFQTFTLPFILWSQLLFFVYRDTRRDMFRNSAILVACAGALFDWDVLFWMVEAAAYEAISPARGSSRWRAAIPWAAACAAMATLVVTHILLIAGSGNELFGVLLKWIDGGEPTATSAEVWRFAGWFSTVFQERWWLGLGRLFLTDFTAPVMIAALGLALLGIVRRMHGDRRVTGAERLVAASATAGLLYLLAIPAALGHEYGLMPLSGAVCWAAAAAIVAAPRTWRVPIAALTLFCVIWVAGPWIEMWFGSCFAPYRINGRCERPLAFGGFGKITYRIAPRS